MTNEIKKQIINRLIQAIYLNQEIGLHSYMCNELTMLTCFNFEDLNEFQEFLIKNKPSDALGLFLNSAWWDGNDHERRIQFLKDLLTKTDNDEA